MKTYTLAFYGRVIKPGTGIGYFVQIKALVDGMPLMGIALPKTNAAMVGEAVGDLVGTHDPMILLARIFVLTVLFTPSLGTIDIPASPSRPR